MLKKACFLTGDNHLLVAADTPASKKKIIAFALAMMIPVMIWVFSGFMLSLNVLQAGLFWAIITGLVCGTIVFLIEKLIVMANGNRWLNLFRILIGFVVAALGSIAIDEVVFEKDIDISVAKLKKEFVAKAKTDAVADFNKINNLGALEAEITEAETKYDVAEKNAMQEADGSNGTGQAGVGAIARKKEEMSARRKTDLNALLVKRDSFAKAMTSTALSAEKEGKISFNEHALLIRIQALFELVAGNGYMLITYLLFTALLLFFEFLVVILKFTWKKTNYEAKLEMIEEIGRNRMAFLNQQSSPLNDPGNYMPQYEGARNAISKTSTIFN
ncbi:MAG: DUF4407 domain-containing protein [Flavobacterium sp.]|nr:MAG: DUF4407 domain-containing protein [Flavobacterium sp.]